MSSLLAVRITELPQNREGYKKLILHNREDNKKIMPEYIPLPPHPALGMGWHLRRRNGGVKELSLLEILYDSNEIFN